jgi:hypothetical protein
MMKTSVVFTVIASSIIFAGCQKPKIQLTQLQLREMQTRQYDIDDTKRAVKSVLNVLQDDGFIVKQADLELGFVNAVKEFDVEDAGDRRWAKFWHGSDAEWDKHCIIDCSANVTKFGTGMRVRVNFQRKVLDNNGHATSIIHIEDPVFYQEFFSKVDKGIFIEKEQI